MKTHLTPFQTSVLMEIAKIPFGEVRTYKQIAEAIGKPKSSRAVGLACNKNPFPFIIPCHRVVGSNKNTSKKPSKNQNNQNPKNYLENLNLTGYAFGLPLKKQLLQFEALLKENLAF